MQDLRPALWTIHVGAFQDRLRQLVVEQVPRRWPIRLPPFLGPCDLLEAPFGEDDPAVHGVAGMRSRTSSAECVRPAQAEVGRS